MYGVISILDDKHTQQVRQLWQELNDKLDIPSIHKVAVPHFSYHVADHYEWEPLKRHLKFITQQIAAFTIKTTGLGLFTGAYPVVFVPILRTSILDVVHQKIWNMMVSLNISTNDMAYYQLPQWVPHITLAYSNVGHDKLPDVFRLLSERDFAWDININNISIIGGEESQVVRFPLRGQ